MSLLLSSAAMAASSPFTAARRTQCGSRRVVASRRLVLAAQRRQEQEQQTQQQPGGGGSPAHWRHVPAAAVAAAVASGLACSPAALAVADPQTLAAAQAVYELAALDSKTAGALSLVLKPTLSVVSVLMIVRIVMSWYPEIDGTKMPWAIAYNPTESLLVATRKIVPPFNGLDVSPIVWVALLSFLAEILTGPQGILSLIERKGI